MRRLWGGGAGRGEGWLGEVGDGKAWDHHIGGGRLSTELKVELPYQVVGFERVNRIVRSYLMPNESPTTTETRVGHYFERPRDPSAWVYIGRAMPAYRVAASPWANPFRIRVDGTREQVIAKYEEWIRAQPSLLARLPELRGKVLCCWCKTEEEPDRPCHGDVLVALIEEMQRE